MCLLLITVRGRGSFKVDWCCNFVTSCNRSNFYGSYESYECPLPYAIWQPDLLQGAAEVQTKIWRHIGRPRHTSKTHLKTTYQLDFSPDFYISRQPLMSSFRWGIIAHLTPRNSQVADRELRQPLLSCLSSTVVPSSLKNMPQQFWVSHSHCFEQIRLPYLI